MKLNHYTLRCAISPDGSVIQVYASIMKYANFTFTKGITLK